MVRGTIISLLPNHPIFDSRAKLSFTVVVGLVCRKSEWNQRLWLVGPSSANLLPYLFSTYYSHSSGCNMLEIY